jgi:hypothetical protein
VNASLALREASFVGEPSDHVIRVRFMLHASRKKYDHRRT